MPSRSRPTGARQSGASRVGRVTGVLTGYATISPKGDGVGDPSLIHRASGLSAPASAFAIPDVDIPSCRAASARAPMPCVTGNVAT